MADKTLLDNSYTETVAVKHSLIRSQSSNVPALLDDRQHASRNSSRQPSIEVGRDNSRVTSISERRGPGPEYDAGAYGRQKVGLEERLARDRIKYLHDVFVSAQGGEGLSMEEFRSTMRDVFSEEYGRRVEDDELDKVPVIYADISYAWINLHILINKSSCSDGRPWPQ